MGNRGPAPSPFRWEGAVPGDKFSIKYKVSDSVGLTNAERSKIDEAFKHWAEVWNSPEFEAAVKASEMSKPGDEVYEKIMEGIEISGQGAGIADREADIDLKVLIGKRGVVGAFIGNGTTWINRYIVVEQPATFIAHNFAHEYCHTVGYKHKWHGGDSPGDISYEIGRITLEILNHSSASV